MHVLFLTCQIHTPCICIALSSYVSLNCVGVYGPNAPSALIHLPVVEAEGGVGNIAFCVASSPPNLKFWPRITVDSFLSLLNIEAKFVHAEVSKFDKFNSIKEGHEENMKLIFVTFDVSQFNTLILVSELQPLNIAFMFTALLVSQLSTAIELSFEHPLNMNPMSLFALMSQLLTSASIRFLQDWNRASEFITFEVFHVANFTRSRFKHILKANLISVNEFVFHVDKSMVFNC